VNIHFIRFCLFFLYLQSLSCNSSTHVKSRVEDFTPYVGFDGVLSRALASMHDMVSWCQHLPHDEGYFYTLKGQVNQQKLYALPAACSVTDIKALKVPGLEGARHLVILRAKSNE
ncbi:RsmG family class I SAM-dependent methyltransferase, partial [Salinivibrio sp. SS3]|uniref:RsmG family class I SAM-dependent methyltransferase n=1 Tax=Salinivibrio sp. SS3 TaxID=1895021 RepID=UPI000B2D9CCE